MKRIAVLTIAFAIIGVSVRAETAQTADQGKKLISAKKCDTCHTIDGKGGTLTKQYPLDGVGAKLSAADIKKWLVATAEMEAKLEKAPKIKMSSKKVPLTDTEVSSLVAYLETLKEPLKTK